MMLNKEDVDNYWTQCNKPVNVTGDYVRGVTHRETEGLGFTGD